MATSSNQDIQLSLQLAQQTTYVHPPRSLTDGVSTALDKTLTGDLTITTRRRIRVGRIKVVWILLHHPHGGEREVISRYEFDVTDEDQVLEEGALRLPFSLTISHLLPPYTRSPFDIVMSRIFASINEPIPGYVAAAEADPERIPPEYTRDPPTCPETSSIRSESRMAFDGSVNTTKGFLNLVNSARKSLQPARADQPILIPKTMAVESYDRAWRRGDIPLPDFLRPSLAYASLCCGIVSSPDNPGEEPVMEWEKIMRIAGLGRVECLVYSSYFACGSGVDFQLRFTELEPLATVHGLRLMLIETAVAGDGCARPGQRRNTAFTLCSEGDPTISDHQEQPPPYVWRAEIPRFHDAARKRSGPMRILTKARDLQPLPLLLPKGITQDSLDSCQVHTFARLPSPIIGIHATSPVLLDPRITRINHRLRLEVLFSVLGQDVQGKALPSSAISPNTPPEGAIRRLWVEHEVVLRSCMLGPDNTKVPTYNADRSDKESFDEYLRRIDIRQQPKSFDMQSSDVGESVGEGGDLRERAEEHVDDCQARCLCFYGDEAIERIVARRNAAAVEGTGLDQKSVYVPSECVQVSPA